MQTYQDIGYIAGEFPYLDVLKFAIKVWREKLLKVPESASWCHIARVQKYTLIDGYFISALHHIDNT